MKAFCGLAAVLVVLAGCGAPPTTDSQRTIEIFGPYRGTEADRFVEVLRSFSESSGADVRYVGSGDFVEDLTRRVDEDGNPPDLAVVPQPGLVEQFARSERVVALDTRVVQAVDGNYPAAVATFGMVDGTRYAVPFRLTLKSLVWYRPEVFAEHGWSPPRTLEQLDALTRSIADAAGIAPWCFSIAAGSGTGWTATDWVEDIVLREAGQERYRAWAMGALPFADPAIASAFATFRSLVLDPGHAAGGLRYVLETPVEEAVLPLLADPPGCAMYKQADFAASWLPDGTPIGPDGDVDWFALPGTSPDEPPPLLVGGDQIVQFRHDPDVDALVEYLAGPDAGATWAGHGGFISPKSTIGEDAYPAGYLKRLAATFAGTTTVAFDASDQMPPEIGSDFLWSEITKWVASGEDYGMLADAIDRARAAESSPSSTR